MEGVCEELDEAKAEIEKLREECKRKSELSERLKSNHREQLVKAQEASSKIDKQTREIEEKDEEISVLKTTVEDLRGSLYGKESEIKRLSAVNEKLRVDCATKFKQWEEENLRLVSTVEEANGKSFDLEKRIRAYEEEVKSLKGSLLALQKKCSEAENNANEKKELRERENVVIGLEDGKRKIEEELKWKKEQFIHLEEAHRKLRNEFKVSQKEWDSEKSSLLDEICSLQTSLDSQTRISKELQNQLRTCNQVLACEESKRKSLEVQLSDVQGRFENVFTDYEDAKSQLECLTGKRDEEIASLRHSLSQKETVLKEMEYQKRRMEQENEELQISLNEFQESQIQKASGGSGSVTKLQNKLKCSEKMLKESTANLKEKEAELNSQMEKLKREINSYESQLESKEEQINDLVMKLKQSREDTVSLGAKEAEKNSELERAKDELIHYKSQVESRDVIIEELRMAVEQIHTESSTNLQARELEWKSQFETATGDLKKCRSQLEFKDEVISDLRMELEKLHEEYVENVGAKEAEKISQLEKVRNDLNNYKSLLESRDVVVRELRMEFEAREAEWKSQEEMMQEDLKKYWAQIERKGEELKEFRVEMERQRKDYCVNISAKEAEGISQLEKFTSELDRRDLLIEELRSELNKVRRDFAANLKSKEAEWKVQMEDMRSMLDDKDTRVEQLRRDSEDCHSLSLQLKLQNEEISVMLLVLTNGITEVKLKIDKENEEMQRSNMLKEENVSVLEQHLVAKNAEIDRLRHDAMKKSEKISALSKRVESLEIDGHKQRLVMQKEVDIYVEMLVESSIRETFVREQLLQNEGELRKKLNSNEAEWKVMRLLLDEGEARVKKLRIDLEEACSTSLELKLQNEEILVMLLVLKNAISEAELKIAKETEERERSNMLKEENVSVLEQHLVTKDAEIDRLRGNVAKKCEKISALSKGADLYEEMLVESSIRETFLREQLLQNEAEWKVMRSVIDDKEVMVKKLRINLEEIRSMSLRLKLKNEEISEAQSKRNKENEESVSVLNKQLEMKNAGIDRLNKELEKYEEMLIESSIHELFVREENEFLLRKKLKSVCNELERANAELSEKIYECNRMEFELYIWKSVTERFKAGLEKGFEIRKELESSLIAQVVEAEIIELEKQNLLRKVEEKDSRIDDLKQQVALLESEKLRYLQAFENLKKDSLRREFEQLLLSRVEEERIVQTNSEKVNNLLQLLESLEDKLNTSLINFSSQLAEKQAEINLVRENWYKIAASEAISATEIQGKTLLITKLEDDNQNLHHKLNLQQQSTHDLKQQVSEVEAKVNEMKTKLENSDRLIEELKSERTSLVEDRNKLLSERENLLGFFGRLEDTIGEFSSRDENLMDMLESMVISCDEHSLLTAEKENLDSPTAMKKGDTSSNLRSPFRELNN